MREVTGKRAVVGVLMLLCVVGYTGASIFDNKDTEISVNALFTRGVGMYSKQTAPFGDKDSYVTVEFDFTYPTLQNGGGGGGGEKGVKSVEMFLFHSDVLDKLGVDDSDGQRILCCWSTLYDAGKCNSLGKVPFDTSVISTFTNKFYYWDLYELQPNATAINSTKTVSEKLIITEEGIWRNWIVSCSEDEMSDSAQIVSFSGESVWMNPYGHIPAHIFAFLPFYMVLTFLYLCIGIVWVLLSLKYKKDIMFVQYAIGLVMLLGLLENLIFSLDYIVYNSTGRISLGFNIVGIFLSVSKRTFSYVTLLAVTMGATIIKPTLERPQKIPLLVFGSLYFIFSWFYQFVQVLRYTPQTQYIDVPESVEIILLIPVSIMDFIFLYWIFRSLFNSLTYLQKLKQTVKLELFKTLVKVLLTSYIVTFIFIIIQIGIIFSNNYDKYWKGYWFFDGYNSVLHLAVLCAVSYLWRPNMNNSRYAFSTQLSETDGPVEMSDSQTL